MNSILRFLIGLWALIVFSGIAYASGQKEAGSAVDLSNEQGLAELNSLVARDALSYLRVRQRLLGLRYEELAEARLRLLGNRDYSGLLSLMERVLAQKGELFLLPEEVLVGNTPFLSGSPFYYDPKEPPSLSGVGSHAEQFYLYNLKLDYRENSLRKEAEGRWLGPARPKAATTSGPGGASSADFFFSPQARQLWSYRLRDDHVNDYFVCLRQWMKRYEEGLLSAYFYDTAVILRNEYRIFCVDAASGRELWSFAGQKNSGAEFYHSFAHPHQNTQGYELSVSGGLVIAELAGALTAVDITDLFSPRLKWQCELGEYTLCTAPVVSAGVVLTGLVNARGELWFCGFDLDTGKRKWSTYIGTSSFLSPACTISAVIGDEVVLGTNHGLLVALSAASGEIAWIRHYAPKRYSLFAYWDKGHYQDKFLNRGSIAYDTQFIAFEAEKGLYYKPRESDHLYFLDPIDGAAREDIVIDPDRFYILGVSSGRLVFLEKELDRDGGRAVRMVDLDSGSESQQRISASGNLEGVVTRGSKMVFKISDKLFVLDLDNAEQSIIQIEMPFPGWLLGLENGLVIVGNDREIVCLDASAIPRVHSKSQIYLRARDEAKEAFAAVLNGGIASITPEKVRQLGADLDASGVPLSELFPLLEAHLKELKNPAWKGFLERLTGRYAGEVVRYKDVQMRLDNFLYAAGLAASGYSPKEQHPPSSRKPQGLHLQLANTIVLPVRTSTGEPADFFLLLNPGQLVCVDQDQHIRWVRKLFYGPLWESGGPEDLDRHLYAPDIAALLQGNTLIINDHVNIFAVDVHSGAYLWSMTNEGPLYSGQEQLPPLDTVWKDDARRLFVKRLFFQGDFLGGRFIVTHRNKIYSLDPRTGFCYVARSLDMEGVAEAKINDGEIYLLSGDFDRISVLSADLQEARSYRLDFLGQKELPWWPELFFLKDYLIVHARPHVYLVARESAELKGRLDISEYEQYCVEPYGEDRLLVFFSLRKAIGYRLDNGTCVKEWEIGDPVSGPYPFWVSPLARSRYAYLIEDKALIFLRRDGAYFATLIESNSGKPVWECLLEGAEGPFFNLTDCVTLKGKCNFIISTVHSQGIDEARMRDDQRNSTAVDVDSRLFWLDLRSGAVEANKRLPAVSLHGYICAGVAETRDWFVYGLYKIYIDVVSKRALEEGLKGDGG